MGLYIQANDVVLRLEGKVAFSPEPNDGNKMSYALLNRLINEAEAKVERDLSPRYFAPFQTDSGQPFSQLPVRPTMEAIRTMCELKSAMRVLQTDFGRGSAVNGDAYFQSMLSEYKEMLKSELELNDLGARKNPPLPGLKLNYGNQAADDGFSGMVISTSEHGCLSEYPVGQITSPGENFWSDHGFEGRGE